MRNVFLATLGVAAVGCSYNSTGFDHESVLFVESSGVALNHDGGQGMAGMYDATCVFSTPDASIGEDYDMPSDDAGVHGRDSDDTVTAAVPAITGAVAPKLAPSMRTVSSHSALGASVAARSTFTLVTDGGENGSDTSACTATVPDLVRCLTDTV